MDEMDLSQVSLADLKDMAMKGNSEAQFELGLRYLYGEGARKSAEKAATWIGEAANQGHAHAQVGAARSCL